METKEAKEVTQESALKGEKKPFYKKWWFWAIVVLGVIIIVGSNGSNPSDLIDLPEDEYKAQCQVYTYDEIARHPEQYEKKLAKFTGKVVQVIRDGNNLQLRVNVTMKYGSYYEDTMYVYYTVSNNNNILEDDIITMYGELRGIKTYETVLGAEMSIPLIYVKYVDVKN